jgi:hypothetical protein
MSQVVTKEMEEIRSMIILTVAKRDALKKEMQEWYEKNPSIRFQNMSKLITTDATLSELDSHYKRLWDYYNQKEIS